MFLGHWALQKLKSSRPVGSLGKLYVTEQLDMKRNSSSMLRHIILAIEKEGIDYMLGRKALPFRDGSQRPCHLMMVLKHLLYNSTGLFL